MGKVRSILLVGGASLAIGLSACQAQASPPEVQGSAAAVVLVLPEEPTPPVSPEAAPAAEPSQRVIFVDYVDPESRVYLQGSDGSEFRLQLQAGYVAQVDGTLGAVISRHVQGILDARYAYGMNQEDFFHGHFLFEPNPAHIGELPALRGILESPEEYTSEERLGLNGKRDEFVTVETTLESYLAQVSSILYHTREWTGDSGRVWRGTWPGADERAPGWDPSEGDNLPRSIIGTLSGELIIPTSRNPGYYSRGNVIPLDPFFFEGDLLSDPSNGVLIGGEAYDASYGHVRMEIDGVGYTTWGQFILVKDAEGGYGLVDGLRYDILLQLDPVR